MKHDELPLTLAPRVPKQTALYDALRTALLAGRLEPTEALPSTRSFARQLGVSRGVVVAVYEQLHSEGYLTARRGSGTVVAEQLPDATFVVPPAEPPVGRPQAAAGRLSRWGRTVWSPFSLEAPRAPRPFRPHLPAVDHFPLEVWSNLVARTARRQDALWLGSAPARGSLGLRRALVEHLRVSRAVTTHEDAVVIVPSVQQALDLTARLVLDAQDQVWLEDPGYVGARAVFEANGARVVPVPVDERGLVVARGAARAPRAKLAYVTPGHQWPLGVTMAIERRAELLAWARDARAFILEDDYDSEYRYEGRPVPALKSLDVDDRVIHVGAFSKTLLPSVRLAYVVLPQRLVEPFVMAKTLVDRHTPLLLQDALAAFIDLGHFGRHVRRMRVVYDERRRALTDALAHEFAGTSLVEPFGSKAGLGFAVKTPRHDDRALTAKLASLGLEAMPLSEHSMLAPRKRVNGLLLGFAPYGPARLRQAVQTMAGALRR